MIKKYFLSQKKHHIWIYPSPPTPRSILLYSADILPACVRCMRNWCLWRAEGDAGSPRIDFFFYLYK